MNRTRRRIVLLAPVASIALLAGCADHSSSPRSVDSPGRHDVSTGGTADKVRTVRSGASVTPAEATSDTPTPAPEFRSTTVYGLARKVTLTKDGAELVWDKADWQFNAPGADRNGMDSCHTYDHGDVLTNCNPMLRTTEIPAGAPTGRSATHRSL